MPMPRKLNGPPALIAPNVVLTIVAKKGITTTVIAATMNVTVAPTIVSTGVMIARRAPEADRTTAADLITQSTPSMLLALSAPTTPTTPSSWTAHVLFIKVPSIPWESARA